MNVVNLKTFRIFKERERMEAAYRVRLLTMSKAELLDELLHYHDAYHRDPHDLSVTLRTRHLVEVLDGMAELDDMKELLRELQVKVKHRIYKQIQEM